MNSREKYTALSQDDRDRIVQMAWEDRTPFDAILAQFDIKEQEVIELMRREMKPSSWRMWRERVQGRSTKHSSKANIEDFRHHCSQQRTISMNKIAKR